MTTIETLRMIAGRCPELGTEVGQAVKAINANSPIIPHRLNNIATQALASGEFSQAEREQVAELFSISGNDHKSATLNIRITETEKNHLVIMAEDNGQSLSDYVRSRLGLE